MVFLCLSQHKPYSIGENQLPNFDIIVHLTKVKPF